VCISLRKAKRNKFFTIFCFIPASELKVTAVKVKVKVNFTLEQTTKVPRGSRGIAMIFL
jgi:hypothetical protein